MPNDDLGVGRDPERLGRRAVWAAWLLLMVIAGGVYALKAAEDRSAILRWRHQMLQLWEGRNIWDDYMFPNPPIMPILLYPFVALPPMAGAMSWFALKVVLTAGSILLCSRMAERAGRRMPWWGEGLAMLLSLRPILSDLHHGNINIVILFLIVLTLWAWRSGRDLSAGMALALAITLKVTPALFVPYFLYKRSWRVAAVTMLGLGLFFLVVPSMVLGPEFNGQCLAMWWHRILRPWVVAGHSGHPEINQSMVGVLMRLLTESTRHGGRYDQLTDSNVVDLDPRMVVLLIKGLSVAMVGLLAWLCRTKSDRRDDPRLLGEFSLVVLTMLFVSERSWKHHYVTLLLPYTYLVYRVCEARRFSRLRLTLLGGLLLSAILMVTTSSEVGGLLADGLGHKIAQGYGLFFWSGVVLYAATAWRVRAERRDEPSAPGDPFSGSARALPAPHLMAEPSRASST